MNERPTHELATTNGHTVVLRDYITGAENRQIKAIYINTRNIGDTADAAKVIFDAEDKTLELVVVSVDGKTENVAAEVMALPVADQREVADEVTEIVEGKKKLTTS